MASISKKIVKIRVDKGLSQEEFAKKIGISRSYLKDIETGRVNPSRNFLEKIHLVFGVSVDWLFSDSKILDLIEANKNTPVPHLIFVFGFTQEGIQDSETILRDILSDRNAIFIDAQGKTAFQIHKEITGVHEKWYEVYMELTKMLSFQDIILVLKYMSLSKQPRSGQTVRDFFKIIYDFPSRRAREFTELYQEGVRPTSSIIVLDYPSYLEKNMESSFGYYAFPVYLLSSHSRK